MNKNATYQELRSHLAYLKLSAIAEHLPGALERAGREKPGYTPFLADLFGPENVGAIHGALLTAWSAAAVVGPVIITELSNSARAALPPGASKVHIYDKPLEVLAAMLAVGFVLTILVQPLTKAEALTPSVEAAGAR